MTDTAQPETAAESVVASDPFAEAANAFKASVPENAEAQRLRDEQGRFASAEQAEQEIEAEDEEAPTATESEAESHEETGADEAADEAQPEAVDLPISWPSDKAEMWETLPADARDFIVQRDAEVSAAVNAKFQEAANVRKANEAVIMEANANRQRFAETAEFVLSLVQPQKPPRTMLDPQSGDYNPDGYHLANARYEEQTETIQAIAQQRADALAQLQQEAHYEHVSRINQINEQFGPALIADFPDIADSNKAGQAIADLARYATTQGVPEEQFADPELRANITAPMLHVLWKAQQYDKMKVAKGKVQPKAAKPAAPPVRPGVATPRSAIEGTKRKADFDRLAQSGSIADGAAVWKHFIQGK